MLTYPNAKINLGLNITEKRPDGYHNLETVFYPIPLQDAIEVTRHEGNQPYTLKIKGVNIEGEPDNNLVIKAYNLLKKDFSTMPSVDIHMYKHIPTGAGLGGGHTVHIAAEIMEAVADIVYFQRPIAVGVGAASTTSTTSSPAVLLPQPRTLSSCLPTHSAYCLPFLS